MTISGSAIELGKAAEHLVCADLILSGVPAHVASAGSPYDIIADPPGGLVRIQVKAVQRARRGGYVFAVRRRGKNGAARLTNAHCDLVAMVALDIRSVAYLPVFEVGQTCELKPPGYKFPGNYLRARSVTIADLPFTRALDRFRTGPAGIQAAGDVLDCEAGLIEHSGRRQSLAAWAREYGRSPGMVQLRLARGWPLERALGRPPRRLVARNG